jgi:hypothetical protein
VFEEFSSQTGISLVIDDRHADKLDIPMTATFRNDVTLEDALTIVTNKANLKVARLPSALYVTSPENARSLEAERKEPSRKKKRNK